MILLIHKSNTYCFCVRRLLDGFPNSRTCLLHQKLQMINICVDRRKRRDEVAKFSNEDQSSESEDEFYECDAEGNEGGSGSKKTYLPWNKPVGRLGKFCNMKLIETGDPLYVPITQEPVPKTEDQLEQDAEVMLKLGTDAQASEMRANIMSASLLSDMESFKAANPDGIFDDFIKWYSPRDWIEEENENGENKSHLSTRMLIPDNMWVKIWVSAKPVPAKRQRRLFDDTTEAEKILHFLESRSIAQIVDLLLPSLTHAVLSKVAGECENRPELPQLKPSFDRLLTSAMKFTRERVESEKYTTISEYIYAIELAIAQSKSLRLKFNVDNTNSADDDMIKFLSEVLSGEEANLPGAARGPIGSHVVQMYKESFEVERDLDLPSAKVSKFTSRTNRFLFESQKDFVLRVMARRPSSTSASTLQMMRVIIKNDEFRVLGAFAEDVIFS